MAKPQERVLLEILDRALDGGAEEVTLEYAPEGIEVCYRRGPTGVGHVLAERELIPFVASRARLASRGRGEFSISVGGRRRTILVEAYDSFGETALRLRFGKDQRPRKRR